MKTLILTTLLVIFSFSSPTLGDEYDDLLNWSNQREQTQLERKSLRLQEQEIEHAEEQRRQDRYREDLRDMEKAFGY